MATLLTKDYQKVSTISLTYGEIRTYAKYEDQSTEHNKTYIKIKATYYIPTQASVSFDRGTININSETTDFGSTTFRKGETDLKEISKEIEHNADGSSPDYEIYTAWWATFGGYGEAETSVYAPTINRIAKVTSATDFNDETNPVVSFTNPANFRLVPYLSFYVNGSSVKRINRTLTNYSSPYTWSLTNSEREEIRQTLNTLNSCSVKIGFDTYNSSGTRIGWNSQEKKFTIINANPIFSNFTFEDINPTTLALTGSSSINVNGYSNTKITISSVNKAEAQKEASMIKYRYSNGDKTTDINYSDSDVNGTINGTTSGTHNVYAIDSRNNSTLVTKLSSQVINYQNITIDKQNSFILRTNNGVGNGATLTLNGTIWNDNFGLVTNSIKSVTYQLKKTDSSTWAYFITPDTNYLSDKKYYTYSNNQYILLVEGTDYNVGDTIVGTIYQDIGTTTITPIISSNTFTFTGLIASNNQDTTWDLNASYNVKVTISDELSSVTIDLILNSAIPTLSLDKEGVGVMCAYNNNIGGSLQVNEKIIDGGTLLWVNQNPTADFSGQRITLPNDDYDVLEFYWRSDINSTDGALADVVRALKGYGAQFEYCSTFSTNKWVRRIIYVDDVTFSVWDCLGIHDSQYHNEFNVPLYIVGYKTNLFS